MTTFAIDLAVRLLKVLERLFSSGSIRTEQRVVIQDGVRKCHQIMRSSRLCLSNNIRDQGIIKDLRFLEDWEQGSVPWSWAASVLIRVRKLRRVNGHLCGHWTILRAPPVAVRAVRPLKFAVAYNFGAARTWEFF